MRSKFHLHARWQVSDEMGRAFDGFSLVSKNSRHFNDKDNIYAS